MYSDGSNESYGGQLLPNGDVRVGMDLWHAGYDWRIAGQVTTVKFAYNWYSAAATLSGIPGLIRGVGELAFGSTAARVFWSGGKAAMQEAASYATVNGAKTLEMTPVGKTLEFATERLGYRITRPLWSVASRQFAAGAAGDIQVFHGSVVGLRSVWATVEWETLLNNPEVRDIIFHNVFKLQ